MGKITRLLHEIVNVSFRVSRELIERQVVAESSTPDLATFCQPPATKWPLPESSQLKSNLDYKSA